MRRHGSRGAYPSRGRTEIEQTTAEFDDSRRFRLLHEADRMLWDDLPIVPLFQVPVYLAVRNTSVNVGQNVGNPASTLWSASQWGRKA